MPDPPFDSTLNMTGLSFWKLSRLSFLPVPACQRWRWIGVLALAMLLPPGCGSEESSVRVHSGDEQEIDRLRMVARFLLDGQARDAVATSRPVLEADTPGHWVRDREGSPGAMGVVRWRIKDDEQSAAVSLIAFEGYTGDPRSDIARWRRDDLGFRGSPPEDAVARYTRMLDHPQAQVRIYDLPGPAEEGLEPERRVLAAQVNYANWTWFLKILGDDELVRSQVPVLEQYLLAMRIRDERPEAMTGDRLVDPDRIPRWVLDMVAGVETPEGWRGKAPPYPAILRAWTAESAPMVELTIGLMLISPGEATAMELAEEIRIAEFERTGRVRSRILERNGAPVELAQLIIETDESSSHGATHWTTTLLPVADALLMVVIRGPAEPTLNAMDDYDQLLDDLIARLPAGTDERLEEVP
ncbi:MAG: hypothetical protein JJU36_14970 [Phycisphaeraceae bacterium]|nr:hypothetical protein [Phycisphaeraceae bacterium]